MDFNILNKINTPDDVKKLNTAELKELASDIREALLRKVSTKGGHFGPNLGMVEATIAMHYVFNSPVDKIVYDVSHQSYPHKMLTGRKNAFTNPEEYKFQEDKQFIFEGILYSALTLYNNGGASRSKLQESHKRWVQEIEAKNEEKLSRTQQLNTVKIQALKELNYTEINAANAAEVFEKIAEIQSRKV